MWHFIQVSPLVAVLAILVVVTFSLFVVRSCVQRGLQGSQPSLLTVFNDFSSDYSADDFLHGKFFHKVVTLLLRVVVNSKAPPLGRILSDWRYFLYG